MRRALALAAAVVSARQDHLCAEDVCFYHIPKTGGDSFKYLLRDEPTLKEYWQLRDACRTTDAVAALKNDVGGILSATYIKPLPGVRSRLAMRLSDLEVMGRGGESINIAQNTKSTIDKITQASSR